MKRCLTFVEQTSCSLDICLRNQTGVTYWLRETSTNPGKSSVNFNGAVNKCVPFRNRHKQVNTKPKYWTNEISRNLTIKKRAHNRYLVTRNLNDRDESWRVRRETKWLIRQIKKNLEEHIANSRKSNSKEFYSYVTNKKVIGSTIGPLATTDGNIVNEDTAMANILNYFFASVFYRWRPRR